MHESFLAQLKALVALAPKHADSDLRKFPRVELFQASLRASPETTRPSLMLQPLPLAPGSSIIGDSLSSQPASGEAMISFEC